MNKFLKLIVIIVMFHNGIALAQTMEITVLNKNLQPLAYAYVLVNGKPTEITDTMGIANIPLIELADNDSISVSYLGAYPAWIIFDDSLKLIKKHCFYLDESSYSLGEVLVSYQDIEKLFRKSIKRVPQINYNCIMNAEFLAKLTDSTETTYNVSGTLEATNEVWSKDFSPYQYGLFHHPLKLITDSDTSKINHFLNLYTHQALILINSAIAICQIDNNNRIRPVYSYLGEKDDFKVFRISYPPTYMIGFYFSILLYLDQKTKTIHSVEIEAVHADSEKNKFLNEFSAKFDCELYTHKNPKKNTIYLPVNVHYIQQEVKGFKFDLELSDVTIRIK